MKRLVIVCKKQYEDYIANIQSTYDYVEVYMFEIDDALAAIPGINPGAVVFLNYYAQEDYKSGLALEHVKNVRAAANHQILILSSSKPPVEFIMQASEYGTKVQWGKEIDFDVDNIPETEPLDTISGQVLNQVSNPAPDEDVPGAADKEILVCINEFRDLIPGNCTFIDRFEDIPDYISEKTKAVIITSSMLAGTFSSVKSIVKRIPKESVKLYAIDNFKLNQLIYGEIGQKEGIKFYPPDQIHMIFEDIRNIENDSDNYKKPEAREDPQKENDEEKSEKRKFKFNFGSITEKISSVVEATKNIPKPEIKIPKLQFKDTSQASQAAPKKRVEFVERNKILLIMSPMSTGKTEIASNLAAAFADEGLKTALVDLDTSKKGCFYNFPLFEKEDLFTMRKICMHLANGGLEENIENYAYKSGGLHVYTAHRDVEVLIDKATLKSFVKHLKGSFDVVVIDVGKELSKDIIESLMDADGIKKLLVTTQSIEHLNTIPYCYKWFSEFPLYYKDWILLVNRYRTDSGISDSDIGFYFEDPDLGHELSFKLNRTYTIAESDRLIECKSKRSTVYGKDGGYSEGIKKIVEDWKKGAI